MRWMLLGLVACSGGSAMVDAGRDAYRVPATITIKGIATARSATGQVPVPGLAVTAAPNGNQPIPPATTTTDANGAFSVTIVTNGSAADVHLHTTSPAYADTYFYFPTLLDGDRGASLDVMTPAAYALVYSSTGITRTPGTALLEVRLDGTTPYGAVFSSLPSAPVKYTSAGVPDPNATSTGPDGIGYVLNVPAGNVEIYAASASAYFPNATLIKGHADALDMITILPGPGGD